MIKAVIFDFGGVLFVNGFYEAYKKYSKFQMVREKLIAKLEIGELSNYNFQKQVEKAIPNIDFKKIENYAFSKFTPIKENFNLIKELSRTYQIGILTNNVKGWINKVDKQKPFKKYFKIIIDSSEVRMRKPGKEIYQLIAKKFKLKSSECVLIDDLQVNINGADKAGMKGILYYPGKDLQKELKSLGVKI